MNIFAVHEDPYLAATMLPDKHIVKMPLECCQMLSIVYSKWYLNLGAVFKADGTPYATEKGAFRNHPCTQWVAKDRHNIHWLLQHAIGLCEEYTYRYDKIHSCEKSIRVAALLAPYGCPEKHTPFARAMPDEWKQDTFIDTITAYRRYVSSKPWVFDNYLRKPDRRPDWIVSTTALDPMSILV
jgi:hypothetical protein